MMDSRVVDIAQRLAPEQLLAQGQLRGFYKLAMKDFLAPETITKPKHGFGFPFGYWLQQDASLQSLVGNALASLSDRGIFREHFLNQVRQLQSADAANYFGELVWIMFALEMWLERHD